MVQSPSVRLLTEAAAAALYRTAAQVTTEAQAKIDAMLTALRGQPSGLATLGADGILTPSQRPPGAAVYLATKAADTAMVSTTTITNDPHLRISALPLGVYRVDALLRYSSVSAGLVLRFGTGAGAPSAGIADSHDSGNVSEIDSAFSANVVNKNFGSTFTHPATNSAVSFFQVLLSGFYRVTDPSFSVAWRPSTSISNPVTVTAQSSFLRLERLFKT